MPDKIKKLGYINIKNFQFFVKKIFYFLFGKKQQTKSC